MPTVTPDLRHKLRYLIHLGLTEIRSLAYEGGHDARIAKLADVLEFLPRYLEDDREPDLLTVREQFEQYQVEHPAATFNYLAFLDGKVEIPDY